MVVSLCQEPLDGRPLSCLKVMDKSGKYQTYVMVLSSLRLKVLRKTRLCGSTNVTLIRNMHTWARTMGGGHTHTFPLKVVAHLSIGCNFVKCVYENFQMTLNYLRKKEAMPKNFFITFRDLCPTFFEKLSSKLQKSFYAKCVEADKVLKIQFLTVTKGIFSGISS